jgi:hypothetical protein
MSKEDLLRYWPSAEEVAACIKTEAEAASEEVCLAVHQPMRFERRVIGSAIDREGSCDEYELLRAFLSEKLTEGRVILPIEGSSGVGKSHVVRWLHAQIHRMPGADRRVVIRIPKGTSLKGVLTILLEKLEAPAYTQYRQQLSLAQERLNPAEAAGQLCEALAYILEEMAIKATQRLRENPLDKDARDIAAYSNAKLLPTLLRTQLLRDQHFVRTCDNEAGVAKRLVEQLSESRPPDAEDDRQHVFTPNDLVFDLRIERSTLGLNERKALEWLDRQERRDAATRVLNKALDSAKNRLLAFGSTVLDLFDSVRRELLKEGKELVLLVEDFADLSGLQNELLQAAIREAIREGKQVVCTMRTALAYTTGYLEAETVLTRANVVYRIPDQPGSEDEILGRIGRLVGSYLNAARMGERELAKSYRRADLASSTQWVPRFEEKIEPDARATLDVFGSSDEGYELFPFNESAIHELAREGCLRDGRLVYNPRFVIQNVIKKVLINRDQFQSGDFPQPTFGRKIASTRLFELIRTRVSPGEIDRYLSFLAYWGESPTTLEALAHIPLRLFEAFGLRKPTVKVVDVPTATSPKAQPSLPDSKAAGPVLNETESKWEKILEEWRSGTRIPQTEAHQLRNWVIQALDGAINWDWNLFRPRNDPTLFTRVFIPLAGGDRGLAPNEAMAVVCTEEERADQKRSAAIASALLAVVRFHDVHKGSWDYEGADFDIGKYASLIDAMVPGVRRFVLAHYFRVEMDPLRALVQGLLVGARVLGIDGADQDSDDIALVNALYSPVPEANGVSVELPAEGDEQAGWTNFSSLLAQCRQGNESSKQMSWIDHLKDLTGARQGGASTVYAVDLFRLKPVVEETLKNWTFTESPREHAGAADWSSFRTAYLDIKRGASAIEKARKNLLQWRARVLDWMGENCDKDSLVEELKITLEASRTAGLTAEINGKRLLELIEAFRMSKVKAAIDDAARLSEGAPRGTVLTVLGRGYWPVARISDELRESYDHLLSTSEAELSLTSQKYGADPLGQAKLALQTEFEELEVLLRGIPQ